MVHIVPMYMKIFFLLRNKVFLALRGGKEFLLQTIQNEADRLINLKSRNNYENKHLSEE